MNAGIVTFNKSVLVLAVPHELQGPGFRGYVKDPSYETFVEDFLWSGYDFVFEEAAGRQPSIARDLAVKRLGVAAYLDFDPPPAERPKFGIPAICSGGGPIDPAHSTDFYESCIVGAQRLREEHWVGQIQARPFTKAVAICGVAHALSLAFRLETLGLSESEARIYLPYSKLCKRQHTS
jgi:hypothetical protein